MTEYIITRTDLSAIQRTKIDLYGGVELVRCKDCKMFCRDNSIVDKHGMNGCYGDCTLLVTKGVDFGDEVVHESHYCGWAEREEE